MVSRESGSLGGFCVASRTTFLTLSYTQRSSALAGPCLSRLSPPAGPQPPSRRSTRPPRSAPAPRSRLAAAARARLPPPLALDDGTVCRDDLHVPDGTSVEVKALYIIMSCARQYETVAHHADEHRLERKAHLLVLVETAPVLQGGPYRQTVHELACGSKEANVAFGIAPISCSIYGVNRRG